MNQNKNTTCLMSNKKEKIYGKILNFLATKNATVLEFAEFHEVEVFVIYSYFIDLLENNLIKKVDTAAYPGKKIFFNLGGFDLIVSSKSLDLKSLDLNCQFEITIKGKSAFKNLRSETI
jgi:hypothetical protein